MAALLCHLGYKSAYSIDRDSAVPTNEDGPTCYLSIPYGPLVDCWEAYRAHLLEQLSMEPSAESIGLTKAGP